jgi:hypothetical protein
VDLHSRGGVWFCGFYIILGVDFLLDGENLTLCHSVLDVIHYG